jgi:hypothetical protein
MRWQFKQGKARSFEDGSFQVITFSLLLATEMLSPVYLDTKEGVPVNFSIDNDVNMRPLSQESANSRSMSSGLLI